MSTLHVLVAAHNRRKLTLRAFAAIDAGAGSSALAWRGWLVDDGSTDGTSEAVARTGFDVSILPADGSLYWARSMQLAEAAALDVAREDDWILWLNDDVELNDDWALQVARIMRSGAPSSIFVGAVSVSPGSPIISYSGLRRTNRFHPLRLGRIEPKPNSFRSIDTFNGNFVLLPVPVARTLGGIDGQFAHGLADIDYGLRARQIGVDARLLPAVVGACPRNPAPRSTPLLQEWRAFVSPKGGGNFASLVRFHRRHAPRIWYITVGWTYVSWFARSVPKAMARTGVERSDIT